MLLSPNNPSVVGWISYIDRIEPQGGGIVYDCTIHYQVGLNNYTLKESVSTSSFHASDSVVIHYLRGNPKFATIRTSPDLLIDIAILLFLFTLLVATVFKNWK